VDKKLMTSIIVVAVLLMLTADAWARRIEATNTSAEVELELRLYIPSIVSVQIGTAGKVVDTVAFYAKESPLRMPVVRSDVNPPIIITSNTPQGATLLVDSSAGLKSDDNIIPLSVICWKGTEDLSGSEGCFDGSTNQRLRSFPGKGSWKGSYIFEYKNSSKYPPGTYTGRITYTLTTP
jgi:hypothetical protein